MLEMPVICVYLEVTIMEGGGGCVNGGPKGGLSAHTTYLNRLCLLSA